jgi:uncharacterized protein (TIGR03083 family)
VVVRSGIATPTLSASSLSPDIAGGSEGVVDVMAMARDERADMAEFLGSLRAEQWDHQSLCVGWRVRDVAAHVVSYEEQGWTDLLSRLAKAHLRPSRINEVGLAEYAARDPQEIVELLRQHLTPSGATERFGGRVGLVDALIHHQDMRRPLDIPRQIPPERLRCALPFAVTAPPLRGFWNARGVRLVATDLDWSRGKGPEARGAAEAVLMVLAGRPGVARDLTGPGASILRQRLG